MAAPHQLQLQLQVVEEYPEEDQDKISILFEKIQFLKKEVLNIKEINKILKSVHDPKKST